MKRTVFTVTLIAASLTIALGQIQNKKQDVDKLPFPVGGVEAIAKQLKYPDTARKDSVQGVVYVEATVDIEGNVTKAIAQKGVRDDLNAAAVEAIKKVKFIPGTHEGKPVEAIVTIPVAFRLK